ILRARTASIATYLQGTEPLNQYDIQSLFLNPLLDKVGGRTTGAYGAVVLLDPRTHILAAAMTAFRHGADTVPTTTPGPPDMQRLVDTAARRSVIRQALAASHGDTTRTTSGADGVTTIAVPLRSRDGSVRGVLAALFEGHQTRAAALPSDLVTVWRTFATELQPAGFYFIALASISGTLTGVVISRNLGRRLRRITIAAAAWSQGSFEVEVRDPSADELGQLGRDLNRMADQLHSLLAARQHLAVLEERNRLARELHDSVKQHVFANALLVRAARTLFDRDPDKAHAALRDAEGLAGQAQHELDALIRALRPARLADTGLAVAVQELTTEWARRMGIVVEVRLQGDCATPLDIEEALFRVTQEALTNVARHSQARRVDVHLVWSAERLVLTIADDGEGFDVRQGAGKGWGLRHMRERVQALGGALAVVSAETGTRIEADVPLGGRGLRDEAS
ncbi:MAG: histidine kinase, partial [Chloroflexota bacterium]|nr:histidine kinase [Chloroflexota bacterium]